MINDFLKDKRIHFHHKYPDALPSINKVFCDPVTLTVVAATATVAAGGVKAYGQYQTGQAQAKMYEYQGALAQQRARVTKTYAEQQARLIKGYAEQQRIGIEAAAKAGVTITQTAAAERSKQLSREVAELTGTQKATIGALGIGGGVTAADILTSSFDKAALDQLAIRYGANIKSWQIREEAKRGVWTLGEETKQKLWGLREETKQRVWGLQTEAEQYRMAKRYAKRAAKTRMAGTLLQTAGQVAFMGKGLLAKGGGGGGGASTLYGKQPQFATLTT